MLIRVTYLGRRQNKKKLVLGQSAAGLNLPLIIIIRFAWGLTVQISWDLDDKICTKLWQCRSQFSLRASSPIWASEASLAAPRSRVVARLALLAQIGELARRLEPVTPWDLQVLSEVTWSKLSLARWAIPFQLFICLCFVVLQNNTDTVSHQPE